MKSLGEYQNRNGEHFNLLYVMMVAHPPMLSIGDMFLLHHTKNGASMRSGF